MPRFALLTAESAQLGEAITEIIDRHHEDIVVVVTSDRPVGRLLRRALWSGPRFMKYQAYSQLAYRGYLRLDRALGRLRLRRRRRHSVAELCSQYGIARIHCADVNHPANAAYLRFAAVDFLVCIGFDQPLHETVVAAPRRAALNVHAACLPRCRGMFPTLYSAIEPDVPFGVTVHLVDPGDGGGGPILAQRRSTPPLGRSVLFNDGWVYRTGVDLLSEVLERYEDYARYSLPQIGGTVHGHPRRADLAAARAMDLRLSTLGDFLAVCRGTRIATPARAETDRRRPAEAA
jgi:methionyl-tRNA formyltransferase